MKKWPVAAVLAGVMALAHCSKGQEDGQGERPPAADSFLVTGKSLPDLTLEAFHRGSIGPVRLRDFRGRWLILFFYPADFSFVCPTELKELAEYYGAFRETGAEILSVSTDSAYAHRAWHRENESVRKVPFPMLSDRAGKLSRTLGVYDAATGSATRATFLADPQGRIMAFEVHDDSIGRSADELLRKLQAAIAASAGRGGMCPGGWKPGEKLIEAE
jgi:NADH-dependent peroxiredoxin subunit C